MPPRTSRTILGSILVLAILSLLSCKEPGPADIKIPPFPYAQPYGWKTSTPQAENVDADSITLALHELGALSYVESFVLVRNGLLIAEDYYTLEGKYRFANIASVSKSLSSSLVGIALREKYLDSLGQRLMGFFPEYATQTLDPRKRDITIEHLITMRAGFDVSEANDYSYILNQNTDWMKEIINLPLRSNPGQEFNYSSLNTHLVSGILTKASGMSAKNLAQRFLLEPLGISVISWPADPQGYSFAGSGLVVYPRDLARFGYLYVHNGWSDGRSIVPEDWVMASVKSHDDNSRTWGPFTNVRYGYMWWTAQWNGDSLFLAVGFGGQFIICVPRYDLVVVITSNLNCTDAEADQRHYDLLNVVATHILRAVKH